jgi:hypothetical protein
MPGYAATLRRIDDEVSIAASGSDWELESEELARQFGHRPDPALTDRDLQPAATSFEERDLKAADKVAWLTRMIVCAIGVGVMVICLAGMPFRNRDSEFEMPTLLSAMATLLVAAAVLYVAFRDYHDIEQEYTKYARTLALTGLTPTLWEAHGLPQRLQDRVQDDGRKAWGQARRHLGVPSDSLSVGPIFGDGIDGLEKSRLLVPEWSTPWQLTAHAFWHETQTLYSRSTPADPTRSSRREDEDAQRARRSLGIAHARAACQLNPLDPGCRTILAALMIDQLSEDIRLALSRDRSGVPLPEFMSPPRDTRGHALPHNYVSALMTPLPLSETLCEDPAADRMRPSRWRISEALRCAREASILVQIRWSQVRGLRSAAGRLTEVDRIAVDYQLGRGYVLSALNDANSSLSRKNAHSAVRHLESAARALDDLPRLDTAKLLGPNTFGGITFTPSPLCVQATPPSPGQTPDVDTSDTLTWWIAAARWLVARPSAPTTQGIYSFADPWSQDFSSTGAEKTST